MSGTKIRVGEIDIFYRWDGAEDGPIVMMAHAMGMTHRLWDRQVPALADRYRLLRYDWRGHGGTDAPEGPYSLDMFVADAVGLMDRLGLARVHWVGISTGGMIGQGLAIAHPDRVASLALCNTTPQADRAYKDSVADRHKILREHGMTRVWEMTNPPRRWFSDAYADGAGAEYAALRQAFLDTSVTGYIGATSATADLAYRDRLHLISAPTLILAAGDDTATPPAHSRAIHARIAGSELTILPGLRHFSNVEAPERFNPPLRAFLDSVSD